MTEAGVCVMVSSVEVDDSVSVENTVTVYNFEVEDWHTYYVGECCVLVHNMCATTGIGKTGEGIPESDVKPEVLESIHRNDDAAYGYLPNENTPYDRPEYDFTDIEWARQQKNIREGYLEGSELIEKEITTMLSDGYSKEDIADQVVNMRNQQKIDARAQMPEEAIKGLEERNMKKYGDPVGPSAKQLFETVKNKLNNSGQNFKDDDIWDIIINDSMKKDEVINTLLGISHK